MTKALSPVEFHFHRQFSLMVHDVAQDSERCECMCATGSSFGPQGVDACRCTALGRRARVGAPVLCAMCSDGCSCPCWGGHPYWKDKKKKEEGEEGEDVCVFLRKQNRKGATTRSIRNPYMLRTPFAHPKRRAVGSPEASPVQYPAIAPPTPPAPVPGAELPALPAPAPAPPELPAAEQLRIKVSAEILECGSSLQVEWPIDGLAALRSFVEQLCLKGRKNRVTYRDLGKFANVPERNVSLFARNELAAGGEIYRRVGNTLLEACNRPYHAQLEALAAAESEGSEGTPSDDGVWTLP